MELLVGLRKKLLDDDEFIVRRSVIAIQSVVERGLYGRRKLDHEVQVCEVIAVADKGVGNRASIALLGLCPQS